MLRLTLVLMLLAVGSAAGQIPTLKGERPVTDAEMNVLATVERMTSAFQKGDLEGVMSSYEHNAAVVFEPGQPVSDPEVLRATFKQWFAMSPRFEFDGHEVFVAGNVAVHLAPWKMRGKAPDGSEIQQSGLSVAVLRRQADGRWLMVIDDPHGQHLLSRPR